MHPRPVGLALKRTFDIVGAATLLLLLVPLFPLVALGVRWDGGPVFYRHTRVGFSDRLFSCLKFRTMAIDADQRLAHHLAVDLHAAAEWASQRKLTNDPRVTPLGALLRATSLDELPQLLNVLRGDMSLIGPRPVVSEELEQHYSPAGRVAYGATRPGITGLWQIGGRSDTTYNERVALDITYVRTWSLLLDMKILLRTIPAVLTRRGAV
jgi:exopolysaccharide production protein ExoY